MNFILQYKLGFNYHWQVSIWGDIFTEEKPLTVEVVEEEEVNEEPKEKIVDEEGDNNATKENESN